jgi:hypothetical protein
MASFIGSVWFALLLGVCGLCVGVWLCKNKKI